MSDGKNMSIMLGTAVLAIKESLSIIRKPRLVLVHLVAITLKESSYFLKILCHDVGTYYRSLTDVV